MILAPRSLLLYATGFSLQRFVDNKSIALNYCCVVDAISLCQNLCKK